MANFPTLKTGAVAQYPTDRAKNASTSVYRFVDGSEQRFRTGTATLHRWVIHLDLLDEAELTAIEALFQNVSGRYGNFSFTDPWDNTVYANCSFDSDTLALAFADIGRGQAEIVVKENR